MCHSLLLCKCGQCPGKQGENTPWGYLICIRCANRHIISLMNIGFGKTTYHSNLGDYYVKQTNFNLQPKAGYFFADKIAGGVELLFSSSSAKEEDETGKEIESLFLFGPFVRYYIPAGNLSAFLELEGGFGAYTDKWTGDNDYKDKHNVVAFGGGAGVLVPVGTKAGFDLSLGYNTYSVKYTGENPEDEKIVTGSFGIKLGFMLFLGGE